MEKKIIKLGYRGFYKSFKLEENIFFKYLIDKELIVIDNKNPEIIIYGEDSDLNKIYSNPKILFKVENIKYNDWNFKYSLSFKKKSENNFFFFNFFYYTSFQNYVNNEYDKNNLKLKNKIKNKYINVFITNPHGYLRNKYLKYLEDNSIKYHSIGRYKKNYEVVENLNLSRSDNKINTIANYKYTISFENSYHDDYITEKIWEPLYVNSIPIYYGGINVFKYFNKKKFIYIGNRNDFNESLKKINKIDQSNDYYTEILNEKIFINDNIKEKFKYTKIGNDLYCFLYKVLNDQNSYKNKRLDRYKFLFKKFMKSFF